MTWHNGYSASFWTHLVIGNSLFVVRPFDCWTDLIASTFFLILVWNLSPWSFSLLLLLSVRCTNLILIPSSLLTRFVREGISLNIFEFLFPHLVMDILIPISHDATIKWDHACKVFVLNSNWEGFHRVLGIWQSSWRMDRNFYREQ